MFWALISTLTEKRGLFAIIDSFVSVNLKRSFLVVCLIKVINVGDRIRMFAMFGLLGFVAGIVANFTAKYAIPWLTMLVFPNIGLEWVLSGFAGAFLTVLLVTVWAYVTAPSEP